MRIPDVLLRVAVIGIGLAFGPALAFDGTRSSSDALALTPMQAFRAGSEALRSGETAKGLNALEYAAEKGHALAQWKLGRMYAEGDGVPQDDLRAFKYFRSIADSHAEDNPATPRARFVANAFVALGNYYLEGIPNTKITADPERARQMFAYAASYFGDPDAQFDLARLYLNGVGVQRDARQAARWLLLAAHKGQCQAQATLGAMLFSGDKVPRQAALGLMWLTLAKDSAKPDQTWISKLYSSAFKQATEDERAMALVYLERLLKNRRE